VGALVAKKGFTLPELLTAIAIIAILIGVLMPALSQVKRIAKETKQKAQIGSIEMGINMYRNDFGAYPPSDGNNLDWWNFSYGGAQTLAEAMFGQDLLGFHVESTYINEGKDNTVITNADRHYVYPTMSPTDRNTSLNNRKGPYLDRTNIDVFDPCQIFGKNTYPSVVSDRYVICDVFTAAKRFINGKNYKIGTPVLYFRANPSAVNTELIPSAVVDDLAKNVYHWRDNYYLMMLRSVAGGKEHPLCPRDSDSAKAQSGEVFYGFIGDPKIANLTRPVRPDSFLLISAGGDGLYGTKDDICNFDPNLP
jgi:prepilin-type N-terminal cleavage/methylation domain-containing protein